MKKNTYLFLFSLILITFQATAQHGNILNGIGAVNYGMGGTSTGNPSDMMGAIYWNPAALTDFKNSELTLSGTRLGSTSVFSGTVPTPAGPASGSVTSDASASIVPSLAYLFAPADSKWRFAISAFGMAGFQTEYGAGSTNPLMAPAPIGLGPTIEEEYALVQIGLTSTYAINDQLSIGITPTLNIAAISGTPFLAVDPDFDQMGNAYYPGVESDNALGFGVQIGLFYRSESGFSAGFSYKTKQSFEDFELETIPTAPGATSRTENFNVDLPSIISLGVGYTADKWKATIDTRFIGFENADGLGPVGYGPLGRALGFGWDNIFVLATGFQYSITDKLPIRVGYSYSSNPVDEAEVIYSLAAPSTGEHGIHFGLGYSFTEKVGADVSYFLGVANNVEGPLIFPTGTVPGASVATELETSFISLNLTYRFIRQ